MLAPVHPGETWAPIKPVSSPPAAPENFAESGYPASATTQSPGQSKYSSPSADKTPDHSPWPADGSPAAATPLPPPAPSAPRSTTPCRYFQSLVRNLPPNTVQSPCRTAP